MTAQDTLFPMPRKQDALPRRICVMHGMYGATTGKLCGGCAHILRFRTYSQTWFKCNKTEWRGTFRSTDWRWNWSACGLYQERPRKDEPRDAVEELDVNDLEERL